MRKLKLFLSLLMVMAFSLGNVWATDYELVTSTSDLEAGAKYVIGSAASESAVFMATTSNTNNRKQTDAITITDGKMTATSSVLVIELEGGPSNWKLKTTNYAGAGTYLANAESGTGNNLLVGTTEREFTISFSDSKAVITATAGNPRNIIRWNSSSTCFSCYASGQKDVYLFKEATAACTKTVSVTKVTPTNGDFAISATEVCGDGDGGEVTISDIEPATGYALDEVSVTVGTYDKNTGKVTGITNDTEISVTFKELQKYTVSFKTGEGNPTQDAITETTAGAGITLPAGPTPACSANGWTFAGWAASAVGEETTTAPTLLSGNYKPTENVTLYAVYKRTEEGGGSSETKYVAAELNSLTGTDVFVIVGNNGSNYAMTNDNGATNAPGALTVTIADGEITSEVADNIKWNISGNSTNGYTFYPNGDNEKWLYTTNSNNGVRVGTNDNKAFVINDAYLYNTGTTRYVGVYNSADWRCYTSINSNITGQTFAFYKATTSAAGTTYYLSAPSCCTKHSVNIALGIQYGKVEADLAEACVGTVVTLTATPDEHCRFVEWDVKQGETPVSVSDSKFTMPEGDVTVSAVFAEIKNAVKVSDPEHGTINVTGAANLDEVLEGTELEASVSGSGYKFTLKAYKYGDETTIVPITDGKLTMPAYGIVITADEQELVSPTILVSKDVIDFGKAVKGGAAPAFETFTISGANLTGDLSLAWEESDGYFTWTVTEGSLTANAGIVEATISVTATEKAMNTAGTLMDNLIVSGGGATQKEVMVGVEVQQTYTAKWFVNGEELTESTQTAVAGTDLIVPTNPTTLAEDCADLKFRGWAAAPIDGKLDDAPEFITTEGLKMGDADANYYAVFATEKKEEIDGDIEWVATAFADLATNDVVVYANASHAMSNNNGTSSAPSAVAITVAAGKLTAEPATTIQWTIEKDGTTIKFKNSTSYLYCTSSNNGLRVGGGDANVFSIKDAYLYNDGQGRYCGVYNEADWRSYTSINSNITGQTFTFYKKTVSKQEVTSYIDFRTTCPSCKTVTLLKADAEHGLFILKQNGVEVTAPVKTCDAAEITIEATPNPGCQFKFANISTLSGASISGTTITLEAGTEGELTVSASFAQNDYKVVLSQTGDAEAELTGATEAAHYGDKIDVSAPAMGGFHFIGWEASGVTLTDATALSQSFSMPANDVTLTAKYAKILTVAEAIAKINADGTSNDQVVEGYISQIDSYNSKYSSITYWIKDIDANGFLTGTAFEVYGGLGLNGAGFTSEDNIVVGAKVRVFGQIKYYETQSIYEFNSNNYQLAYDAGTYTGVVIYGEASKTAYEAGEAFEFDGLNAKDTWSNGYASLLTVKDDGLTWTATPDNITESGDVTVKASYEYDEKTYEGTTKVAVTVLTHAVTFEAPANGELVVKNGETPITSGDKFVKGTVLNIEVSPAIGYKLATLTVNGIDVKAEKQFEIGTELQYEVVATFAEKAEAGIAWSAAKATAVDYEGAVNTLPTLTNAASLEVAYESTNTDVAEIAANGDVTIKASGTATIKAIFAGNETYKEATVTYELTVNHVPVVKLAGSFNDWTGALLTPNEDYTEASVKVNFAADSWPLFKMIVDEEWRGLPKNGDDYYLFHRDWNTVAISDAGGDIQLKADFEGEYTFTWTYATNTLTITFPDMPESEYYIAGGFTSWEDNMAKMTEDAGMYKATVTINATEAQEFKVVRVQGPYKTWYGLAGEATMTPENCTNWTIGGGNTNIGLQPSYAGKYTFYFNEGDMQLTIDMPTEPGTALDNTEAGEKAVKVMKNGQLLIIKNGKTFNAQGAVVK